MEFSSFAFLCFFLPTVLLLHTVIPAVRVRNALLIVASVFFYTYGEKSYVLLLLLSVFVNYLFGLLLGAKKRRAVVGAAVVLNLTMLVVFKYAGFFTEALNLVLPAAAQLPVPVLRLPIGISFYTFQALSYVIDVYRGDVPAQRSLPDLLLYLSFFPQLIAGPIIRYHDIDRQIRDRTVTADGIKRGSFRFACGLGKKILLSDAMALAADTIFALKNEEIGLLSAWVGAVAYLLQIYFDFSGYSDMAIGLGHMFGFDFRENFRYPYTAFSVQDFWRRWHLSLSTWFKEYLYIPLGGNRRGRGRTILNRFIVFLATGLWHGANWTFLLWGLYHGTLLVLESLRVIPAYQEGAGKKASLDGSGTRRPLMIGWRVLSSIYTIFAVLVGFVLFRADTLPQAGAFLAAMFGFGEDGGVGYGTAMRMLSPYFLFVFVLAVAGSTPLPRRLWLRLCGGEEGGKAVSGAREGLMMVGSIAVLVLSFMALASNSYSPFIYFRF